MVKDRQIHLWVPGIGDGSGGIQAFSRVYIQAICESFPQFELVVFVKNDKPLENDPLVQAGVRFISVAGWHNWLRTTALLIVGLGMGFFNRPLCAITTHLHFLPALHILQKFANIPVMSVLHGIEAWNLSPGPRVWAMRAATHLMAVSNFTRDIVVERYGLNPAQISVVPNTFDERRFKPGAKSDVLLKRYGLSLGQPVILTVGRLAKSERYKGHRQVLESLPAILEKFPHLRYLIVGDGDDVPTIQQTILNLGLSDSVTLTGHIDVAELADHYRLCDIFVMPSSNEGFGIVFLEAMACGKPVIAGSVDGSVDALDQGRLGVLVNPSDIEIITESVCQLLSGKHDNKLWNDPMLLHREVVSTFGYSRVSQLMADNIKQFLTNNTDWSAPATLALHESLQTNGRVVNEPSRKLKLVVLTQLTSPYQVEFFNELSNKPCFDLHLIYLTSKDRNRGWQLPDINHNHMILSESPELSGDALKVILEADMVVFNYYTSWFSINAIHQRAKTNKPWVFWGERPGFFKTGIAGMMARKILLHPLHKNSVQIWGVGQFGVDGYRREFGYSRSYANLPYFSDLGRFYAIDRLRGQRRTFFYSGSFTHRKGCDLLAKAFARLAEKYPEAQLILVGSGGLQSLMQDELANCSAQVKWMGFQDWDSLPKAYTQGNILCLPSRYDGWGLALVEGLASGMPAIGTDRTGSALEFLQDGKAGWLIKAGSVDALYHAMEAALNIPDDEFDLMVSHARSMVKHNTVEEGANRFGDAVKSAWRTWENIHQPTKQGGYLSH